MFSEKQLREGGGGGIHIQQSLNTNFHWLGLHLKIIFLVTITYEVSFWSSLQTSENWKHAQNETSFSILSYAGLFLDLVQFQRQSHFLPVQQKLDGIWSQPVAGRSTLHTLSP